MIINEIKSANLQAMKDKNTNLRGIYSVVLNKYNQLEIENRQKEKSITDDDVVKIIQKTIGELNEEFVSFEKVGNAEQTAKILEQKKVLEIYLPKMLSEAEIKDEFDLLEDKSVSVVMNYFKSKYGNSVDLKLVNKILRG